MRFTEATVKDLPRWTLHRHRIVLLSLGLVSGCLLFPETAFAQARSDKGGELQAIKTRAATEPTDFQGNLFPLQAVLEEADAQAKTNLPEALAILKDAVARREQFQPIDQIQLIWVYSDALAYLGKNQAAREAMDSASALAPALRKGDRGRGQAMLAVLNGNRLMLDSRGRDAMPYYDAAEAYFRNELTISQSESLRRGLATTLESKAGALYSISRYADGNGTFREAARLYEVLGDRRRMASALLEAGTSGAAQSLDVSMQETLDVLQVFKSEGDLVGMGMVYQNMGYDYVKEPSEGVPAFEHAIDLSRQTGDSLTEIAAQAGLIETLIACGRYADASDHAKAGLTLLDSVTSSEARAHLFRVAGLAAAYSPDAEFKQEAGHYLLESRAIYEMQGNDELRIAAIESYGEALKALGRPEEAIPLLDECVTWYREHQSECLPRILRLKGGIEEATGDYQSALATGKEYQMLIQQRGEGVLTEKLEKLRLQYQTELKSLEIQLLQKDNELKSTRLKDQQKQIGLLEAQENSARAISYMSLGAGFGALLVIIILIRLFRQKTAAHTRARELTRQLIIKRETTEKQYQELQENLQQLQDANLRLKELDEKRRELLGFAVHDMKNPLGGVRLSLSLIEEEWRLQHPGEPDQLLSLIGSCRDSMDYMLELTEKILEAQVAESTEVRIHSRACDPVQLIEQTVALNRPAAKKKDIELLVKLDENITVMADPQALREVLDNLVSNAVKYSLPKTVVTISLEAKGLQGILVVHDGGPGILPEEMHKLFKPFSKLSARPTAGESSTGLGLYVVKSYIDAMKGRVYVRNAESGGAEFVVELSLVAMPEKKSPTTSTE